MLTKHELSASDFQTLINICRVAADRYEDNAKVLNALANEEAEPKSDFYMSPEQAKGLATQFKDQAAEALNYLTLFADAKDGTLLLEIEPEA